MVRRFPFSRHISAGWLTGPLEDRLLSPGGEAPHPILKTLMQELDPLLQVRYTTSAIWNSLF